MLQPFLSTVHRHYYCVQTPSFRYYCVQTPSFLGRCCSLPCPLMTTSLSAFFMSIPEKKLSERTTHKLARSIEWVHVYLLPWCLLQALTVELYSVIVLFMSRWTLLPPSPRKSRVSSSRRKWSRHQWTRKSATSSKKTRSLYTVVRLKILDVAIYCSSRRQKTVASILSPLVLVLAST